MSWKRLSYRDLGFALVLIAIGAALYFVIMTSLDMPLRWIVLALLLGGVLLVGASATWQKWKDRKRMALRETLIVEDRSHKEIVFAPKQQLRNPTLYLWSSRPGIAVIEVWQAGVGTLLTMRSLDYWGNGIMYEGLLDSKNTLRILLHNNNTFPTTIRAKIVATKEQG